MKIFNNPYNQAPQVWSAQNASIKFSGSGADAQAEVLGALNSISVQFGRTFTTQYPIGGSKPIKMASVPQGTVTLQTIIGPTTAIQTFLKLFGSNCQSFTLELKTQSNTAAEACNVQAKPQLLTCKGCTGDSMSYSIASQGGMSLANGSFTISFTELEWSGN